MDLDQAVEAVKRIKPRTVVPMHMLKADPREFKDKVERSSSATVQVLREGEAVTYA